MLFRSDIHPNSKIIVEYRTSDMSAGVWYGLLTGFITEVSSSYSHTGRTLVTIEVEDMMRRLLNAPIVSFTITAGQTTSDVLDSLIPTAFTAAGLDDPLYTPVWNNTGDYAGIMGAASYTNTTVGAILADIVDAELGTLYFINEDLYWMWRDASYGDTYEGFTTDMDSFTIGYSPDYLFSQINASTTTTPGTVLTKTNTDVSSFFGDIVQSFSVNLQNSVELQKWMTSVTQYSPGIRISQFSTPFFVPAHPVNLIYITDDYNSKTTGIYQRFVSREVFIDANSLSTSMDLFQPV